MIKQSLLLLSFALLPSAALAQHHDHPQQEAKAAHSNFARELIAAKADLKLSDEQIKKLEGFALKMDEMHKKMEHHAAKAEAKADAKSDADAIKTETKLHTDLLAIFNEEQLVKVKPLMKAHMDKCEHMKAAKKAEHKH